MHKAGQKEDEAGTLISAMSVLSDLSAVVTLAEVQALRGSQLGRELPTFSPYSAVDELMSKFKGQWKQATLSCLEEVKGELKGLVVAHVDNKFSQFPEMLTVLR